MRLSADDKEASDYRLFDRDTGEKIDGVVWADDETGEYDVLLVEAWKRYEMPDTERRRGNIELRKIR